MEIIEELAEVARNRPEELRKHKEELQVIGYIGRFIPEELIYSSGALPYLLCRGGQPEPPDAVLPYMLRFLSPYARSQIGSHLLGVDPVVPILDLIVTQCSDCHEARLADLLEYLRIPTFRIGVPPDWEKQLSFEYYYRGLVRLKQELERRTGNTVKNAILKESIQSINKVRALLRKISLLRKEQPPPLGGYDFIRLNHYSFYCDPVYFSGELEKLYEYLRRSKSAFSHKALRILLAGHVVSVGDYIVPKLIEEAGGIVVSEFLDEGIRHPLWEVGIDGDLMRNLVETYYLRRIPPSIFQPAWEKRIESLKNRLEEFSIDGVIWYQLSFEEIYDMEGSILSKSLKEINVPFLKLESSYEYSREAMGPLTTRVESFIESIKQKRGRM